LLFGATIEADYVVPMRGGGADEPWVLVTGGSGNGQSRSALAAVRGLDDAGYLPAVAVSVNAPHTLAAASRFCRRKVRVPPVGDNGFADAVRAELDRNSYLTVLPSGDAEIVALGHPGAVLVDKIALAECSRAAGLSAPPSLTFRTWHELAERAADFNYPSVIKPRVSDPAHPAFRADGPGDFTSRAWSEAGPWLVQPFLTEELHAIAGVVWDDRLVAAVHQRYLRTWPRECGTSCAAETIAPDHDLEARLLRLLSGYEGIFQAQLSGQHLLDMNPRVYGSMPLAAAAGVNLVGVHCDLLRGTEVQARRARAGVFYRWVEGDVRNVAAAVAARDIGWRGALGALRPRPGTAHSTESIRDLGPIFARARLFLSSRRASRSGSPRGR
jgi:predicted ATP-grasp superfamily ATP-dependent carboligase